LLEVNKISFYNLCEKKLNVDRNSPKGEGILVKLFNLLIKVKFILIKGRIVRTSSLRLRCCVFIIAEKCCTRSRARTGGRFI